MFWPSAMMLPTHITLRSLAGVTVSGITFTRCLVWFAVSFFAVIPMNYEHRMIVVPLRLSWTCLNSLQGMARPALPANVGQVADVCEFLTTLSYCSHGHLRQIPTGRHT